MCIEEQLYIDQPWVEAIFYSMYAAILVVGVGSNLVVLYVILGNKHMRTTINIYLLNLAVSDIIICVFASSSFLDRWQFLGSWMCNLTIFGITVSVRMSSFTLVAIAVNRFWAVFYPFGSRINSQTRTAVIILCINLVAIITSLPKALLFEGDGELVCDLTQSNVAILGYMTFVKITQFAIPFAIITICYTSVMIKLRQRAPGRSLSSEQTQEGAAKNARMNKMLIAMVVIFGLCWFPIQLLSTMFYVVDKKVITCWKLHDLTFYFAHVMAMSSACCNPFLYGLMNPAFKSEFTKICSCYLKTRAGDNSESVDSYGSRKETEEDSQVHRISRNDPIYKYTIYLLFNNKEF